jgi:hypothetical protein
MQAAPETSLTGSQHRLHWWKEALIAAAFYFVYSVIRNQFGSNQMVVGGTPLQAFHNAERVIHVEELAGLFREEAIQQLFLPWRGFVRAMNVYYGTAHFFVTIGVFALLFFKRPNVFAQWRNTLAAMTALAIAGFALFPLMPPRLLDAPCAQFGGACIPSRFRPPGGSFGFVDTLAEFGGLWSFGEGGMATVSNQWAAMPSLHIGWATWCAVALWPLLRRNWQRVAVLLYPALTLFCIIVTANHYWLDGVGGLVVFALGAIVGWGMHRWNQDRLDRRRARLDAVPVGAEPATIAARECDGERAAADAGAER